MSQEPIKTYNGWSTFETWAVHLWISNERDAYEYWRDRTKALVGRSETKGKIGGVVVSLADEIREIIEEQCAIPKANLAADLMNAALAKVDWHEIAQALIEDADEAPVLPDSS